jgi:hypothetical protein
MYTIKMDGKVLYTPDALGASRLVLAPKLSLDVDASGSCSFVIPPGNHMHDAVRCRKSLITVHQDNREIFRGRVLDSEGDQYNQIDVYSEGVRSYLNDSQAAPYKYTGTPRGLLEKLISEHNAQIEPEKQFVLGNVTIDRADEALECENVAYWQTFKEIEEKLLSAYGGYLRVRVEGGVMYLDWLKEYGRTPSQKIRFAVNLLDLNDKSESGEMFTILRPLGASEIGEEGEYNPPVNIASVNGGLDYIQDDEAVAKYGKIWHTQTWPYIEDPAVLLKKGQEYMKIGAEVRTLMLKAIDMHFLDGSIEDIRIGDKVHILSQPHGIDMEKVCCKIEIDLANPEETIYIFGGPAKALTDNFVRREAELEVLTGYGGGGRSIKQENNGIIRWATINVNQAQANILLTAGEVNSLKNTMSQAQIEIDGLAAAIQMKASQEEVNDLGMRMSSAEVNLDGLNAEILLKASQSSVDDLGSRMSSAEIEIDGMNSEILLKADKTYVDGQLEVYGNLIVDELNAVYEYIGYSIAESVSTSALTVDGNAWVNGTVTASDVSAGSVTIGGTELKLITKSLLNGNTTISVNASGGVVTGVTLNRRYTEFHFLGYD